MPDWHSPEELTKDNFVNTTLIWVCAGAALYDHLYHIRFDWSILSGQRTRRWPQIFFFGLKAAW